MCLLMQVAATAISRFTHYVSVGYVGNQQSSQKYSGEISSYRSSHWRSSIKKVLLRCSQENICVRVSFLIKMQASGLFYRTPPATASSHGVHICPYPRCEYFDLSLLLLLLLNYIQTFLQHQIDCKRQILLYFLTSGG